MLRFSSFLMLCVALDWFAGAAAARAQEALAGCKGSQSQNLRITQVGNHVIAEGNADAPAQIDCEDLQLMADRLESFQDDGRIIGTGNVVYVSGKNRISAERMEFNTKTRTGTFYNAWGTAILRDTADPGIFGTQEPDAFFWGDELQKIGPKKYRIIHGGFTTCVQPTPRWEMSAKSITLNLDDYALLKSAVLRVKNVPMFYLPAFYYPIQDDNRATGFLMPIYGSTATRGQQLTNQFFWAISRSQDATIEHDWFSKTGQQLGGEYRYILSPGSQGNSQFTFLNEHPTKYAQANGTEVPYPGTRSYTLVGDLAQRLPFNLHARANANYASSIVTQQRYNQNITQSTNRTRRLGGNLSGSWNAYSLSVTADRNDYFRNATSFQTAGTLPRVTLTRTESAIKRLPIYFGVNGEYATFVRNATIDGVKVPEQDQGLTRFDVSPTVRVPFTKLQFFTVNSSVSWRGTYWTESYERKGGPQIEKGLGRTYMDFQSRLTGPVFNRIFNGKTRKYKHVIEPTLAIQHVTAIDVFDRIVKLDGADYTLGTTRYNYGLSNRLYMKKDTSREVLSATLSQSYYTVATASQYENVQRGFANTTPSHFGPVVLQVRGVPTDRIQGSFRTEFDSKTHEIRSMSGNGYFNTREWLRTTVEWTRYVPTVVALNPGAGTNYLSASADVRQPGHRLGGFYSFYYDLRRDEFLQQRYTAYYNSQCCGVAVEYQTYNLSGSFVSYGVSQDRRFNLSFTLAGVGTFSNLFGAFGGGQGR